MQNIKMEEGIEELLLTELELVEEITSFQMEITIMGSGIMICLMEWDSISIRITRKLTLVSF